MWDRARLSGGLAALALCAVHAAAQDAAPARNPEEIFARAMKSRESGDLHEAIRGFQSILAEHPGLNRARIELAVAYYHALDLRAALEEANRVLADPSIPPAVRANVERLAAQIRGEAEPHRFGGSATLGWMHDSNASAGPSSPGYQVGGSLVAIDPNAVKRADDAWLATLGGTHRYFSGLRPGIGGREGALLWQSQLQFHSVDYRQANAFDLQVLSATTGPSWILPPRVRVLIPLQLDRLELGHQHYLDIGGVSPSFTVTRASGLEIGADAQAQRRNYRRPIDVGRDSRYYGAGVQAGRVRDGKTLQAGARINREDAEAVTLDYRGSEWFGVFAWQPAAKASVYLRLTYVHNRYDEPDSLSGAGRTDRETRFTLGASWRLGEGSPEPWSLGVAVLDTRHKSSVELYEFDRTQFSLSLTRNF